MLRLRWKILKKDGDGYLVAVSLIEHLGDIVACEPVARYVRQQRPNATIVWLVRTEYRQLIAGNTSIDVCLVVHCLTEKDYLLRSKLFDRVFDLHFPERHCALCPSWARRTIPPAVPGRIGLSNFYHHGNLLQALALSAGLPALEDEPRVYISTEATARLNAESLPGSFVTVHCSSNTLQKDWPKKNWEELVRYITSTHHYAVVEVGLHSVLAGMENPLYTDWSGRLSILETAEMIRRATLFIGVDSGPAHLANAVGTYGIVLLGSYLGFERYTPFPGSYGNEKNATLIHVDGPVANLQARTVMQSVDHFFATSNLS